MSMNKGNCFEERKGSSCFGSSGERLPYHPCGRGRGAFARGWCMRPRGLKNQSSKRRARSPFYSGYETSVPPIILMLLGFLGRWGTYSARSVYLVTLSLSESGPGRFGGQVSVTGIYYTIPSIPYHTCFLPSITWRKLNWILGGNTFQTNTARVPRHLRPSRFPRRLTKIRDYNGAGGVGIVNCILGNICQAASCVLDHLTAIPQCRGRHVFF